MTRFASAVVLLWCCSVAWAQTKPAPTVTFAEGLSTPESVLYDAQSDTYLVSNINGAPLDKDNNGFITELSPDGKIINAKLVAGGQHGATLHAPKGTALKDGLLYVADIDTVRIFDRATGAPKGNVPLKGATFVNDVALGTDGLIYVSDSGLSPKFESTGSDAIWVIRPGKKPTAKVLIKDKALHGPNGVVVEPARDNCGVRPGTDSIWVVTFGASELQHYTLQGKPLGTTIELPSGGLDGLMAIGCEFFVSSWGAKAVYRGNTKGEWSIAVSDVEAPADFGFDTKRRRLLVPRFQANTVEAWEIP